jgi:CRISPR-associated exonuclease Cas4
MEADPEASIEVPISAIEHYSYCPRQCALIHVEQVFEENVFTIRGRLAHERVEQGEETSASGVRVFRDVPLWSERLGLRGKADVVEMRPEGPYPVEYKVGKRHGAHADLQLCAQALCLEEMLASTVERGAIFLADDARAFRIGCSRSPDRLRIETDWPCARSCDRSSVAADLRIG